MMRLFLLFAVMLAGGFTAFAIPQDNLQQLIDSEPGTTAASAQTTSPETLALLDKLQLEETHPAPPVAEKAIAMPAPVKAPEWLLNEDNDIEEACSVTSTTRVKHFAQALTLALCQDPGMRSLALNMRHYLYDYKQSQASWMPDINALFSTASESDSYGFEHSGSQKQTDRTTNSGIELNWLLFDFGKREALIGQKQDLWLSNRYQALSGLQDFVVSFAQTYYQVLAKRTILSAAKQNEMIARKTWDTTQNKYRSGVGVLADALQAENVLLSATQDRVESEGDYQQSIGQLASALNFPLNSQIHPEDTLEVPSDTQMMALQPLLDEAVKQHPMILAAKKNVEAAEQQLHAAQREFLPSVSLQAGVNREISSLDQSRYEPLNKTDSMFVGLNVSVPLFSGFRRYNQLQDAHVQQQLSQEDYQRVVNDVGLKTWNAWQQLNTTNHNVRLIAQRLKTARRAYDIANGRYLTGVGSIIELLNTQQQLSNTEIDEANIRIAWYLQRLSLLSAIGKLSLY